MIGQPEQLNSEMSQKSTNKPKIPKAKQTATTKDSTTCTAVTLEENGAAFVTGSSCSWSYVQILSPLPLQSDIGLTFFFCPPRLALPFVTMSEAHIN